VSTRSSPLCPAPSVIQGEWRWLWSLQIVPAPPTYQGVTGSLQEAKAEFEQRCPEVKGIQ
jgi:hypothetical protein